MDHPRPRHVTDATEFPAVLVLMHEAFAGMDARIDPPSSLARLSVADLAAAWEVWAIGPPSAPVAAIVLTPRAPALYLGKLAVAPGRQRRGHARALVAVAVARARAEGLERVEVQVRLELDENHAVVGRLGFVETKRSAHPGYARDTTITFAKAV